MVRIERGSPMLWDKNFTTKLTKYLGDLGIVIFKSQATIKGKFEKKLVSSTNFLG